MLALTLKVHTYVLIQIKDSLFLCQVSAAPSHRHLALHLGNIGIVNRLCCLLFTGGGVSC